MENKENYVKDEFLKFLEKQSPQCAEVFHSCVDEIVLSYMVSILEDLGSDTSAEDAFDIESFTEMMEAYMPGFAEINGMQVTEWIFVLATRLGNLENEGVQDIHIQDINDNQENSNSSKDSKEIDEPADIEPKTSGFTETAQLLSNNMICRQRTSSSRTSSTSETGSRSRKTSTKSESNSYTSESAIDNDSEVCLEDDEQVKMLIEMFPATCTLEIAHCLSVAHGNMENAAQLILHRQEAGETVTEESKSRNSKRKKKVGTILIGDAEMKKHIIKKYSYVDTEDDKKQHKPVIPKTEPKKMVRYLDGRIVSTRGERFTEIKKDDDEQMKKTYINLKPARQYRFH